MRKDTNKHIVDKGVQYAVATMTEDVKLRKVMKEFKKGFDAQLFTAMPLPKQDWASSVFKPQWFGAQKNFNYSGLSPMCLMEAKLLMSGSMVICGWSLDVMRNLGADLKVKRQAALMANSEQLNAWIAAGKGFATRLQPGDIILIPSGFFFMVSATEDSNGIRWAVSSDEADSCRVRDNLGVLMDSYPALKNPSKGLISLYNFLNGAEDTA